MLFLPFTGFIDYQLPKTQLNFFKFLQRLVLLALEKIVFRTDRVTNFTHPLKSHLAAAQRPNKPLLIPQEMLAKLLPNFCFLLGGTAACLQPSQGLWYQECWEAKNWAPCTKLLLFTLWHSKWLYRKRVLHPFALWFRSLPSFWAKEFPNTQHAETPWQCQVFLSSNHSS